MVWTMATFIGFTILVAVISYVKTKGDDQSTADGYFLAGRGLPGFVIAGSLLLTNLSAEQLVGTNGQTWSVGMSPMAFEIVAAPCCIVLALFAAPRYLKSGITTIPELIGLRYDRSTKLWFSIAYILLYIVVQIPVILYSGSLVFENIFNVSGILGVTKFQAVIILCIIISVIGSIYAIFGGLKAVAVSDTVNGIGLLIGGFMIPFFALSVLGKTAGGDGLSVIDGMRFMYLALPGVIAYALFELQGDQVSMMDEAYPQLVSQVVPAPLMGFFAAVMLGAILSSFNSVLNSVDTMFTMDIYKEFIDKDASEEKLVKVGKNVGIIFAVLTTIVGPLIYFFPAGLKTFLDSLVMLIALPVLTAVFGGFFFKHLPKYSAKVILVLHVVCYGSFLLFLNSKLHYLYAVFVLLPVELLVMFIFNQRNKAKHPEVWVQKDIGAVDLTPWKYRWVATALILICVAAVYLAFSPLGIGTWSYTQPF